MPTGLLKFALEYAKKDTEPVPGIFTSLRTRFADLSEPILRDLVSEMYDFRNDYIAHQKKELTDEAVARKSLKDWIETLVKLHMARSQHFE